jgi:hypothetical protein
MHLAEDIGIQGQLIVLVSQKKERTGKHMHDGLVKTD